jgi:GNAT superfamily N-acetyltransferase
VDPFDYNFARSIATFAATSKSGEVLETRDAVLTNNHSPVAEFNQCFLKNPAHRLERTLERIRAYQERAGVPLRLQLASEYASASVLLQARGYVAVEAVPGMTLDLTREMSTFAAPGLNITRVERAEDLAAFGRVAFSTFGFPVELAPVAFTNDLLDEPNGALFLGSVNGKPAGCSMLLVTGTVAGIYWVGVEEVFRRRGFAAAITAHAIIAGRKQGCRIASLQASRAGEPVYRRMGFTLLRRYLRFDLPI